MSAQPCHDLPPDPDDPEEILRVLPPQYHGQFLTEFAEAATQASRRPETYLELRRLLRLWRLRSIAYSQPGYEEDMAAAKASIARGEPGIPAEELFPDWDERLAAARARRAAG